MAAAGRLMAQSSARAVSPVLLLRLAILAGLLLAWEALARSGLLYRDVVPPLGAVGAAVLRLLGNPAFYGHLQVTAMEVGTALLIGGGLGLIVGLLLGGSRFAGRAFEPYLYYLGPTPKIIFFPVMIMLFGVGPGSKIAMGALSCFFPVALSAAAGMRGINPVLLRVGRVFGASRWQRAVKIELPAIRGAVANGLRLGLGIAIIGTLLAETKLSNRGLGFMVIENYQRFAMPDMYALLLAIFAMAILLNTLLARAFAGRR